MNTIRRATSIYRMPEHWRKVSKNALGGDYSWNVSAKEYQEIYQQITKSHA